MLRFDDGARTLYLSLKESIHPRHWNPNAERVRKSHPQHKALNDLIEARLGEAETERLRLVTLRKTPTADILKQAVEGKGLGDDVLAYARDFLDDVEEAGNVRRAKKERAVIDKLEAFAGSPLPFGRLTPAFLDAWTAWMMGERGNKASTVRAAITVLRIHVTRAIQHGVLDERASPFDRYKGPRVETAERAKLTWEEVTALRDLDLGPPGPDGSGRSKVREWFMFSLATHGTRFSDLMQLRRSDVTKSGEDEWRLRYRAGKTRKLVDMELSPDALATVAPYMDRPPDGWLFNALDPYDTATPAKMVAALESKNASANKALKKLASMAGIKKKVTFHVARHSFADLAQKAGWSTYDISRALRHSSLTVTDGYLARLNTEALDAKTRALFGGRDDG